MFDLDVYFNFKVRPKKLTNEKSPPMVNKSRAPFSSLFKASSCDMILFWL
jgi:hypothetical protein